MSNLHKQQETLRYPRDAKTQYLNSDPLKAYRVEQSEFRENYPEDEIEQSRSTNYTISVSSTYPGIGIGFKTLGLASIEELDRVPRHLAWFQLFDEVEVEFKEGIFILSWRENPNYLTQKKEAKTRMEKRLIPKRILKATVKTEGKK